MVSTMVKPCVAVVVVVTMCRDRNIDDCVSDTGNSKEDKVRVLPTGFEHMTLGLLVQMLYHRSTRDSMKLCNYKSPLKYLVH